MWKSQPSNPPRNFSGSVFSMYSSSYYIQAGNIKPPSPSPNPTTHPTATSTTHPTTHPTTTSTYEEIMDTLRLLEEVPPALAPPVTVETTTRGQAGSGGLSEGKLQSILSYLDQVERVEMDRSNKLAKSVTSSKRSLSQPPASPRAGAPGQTRLVEFV